MRCYTSFKPTVLFGARKSQDKAKADLPAAVRTFDATVFEKDKGADTEGPDNSSLPAALRRYDIPALQPTPDSGDNGNRPDHDDVSGIQILHAPARQTNATAHDPTLPVATRRFIPSVLDVAQCHRLGDPSGQHQITVEQLLNAMPADDKETLERVFNRLLGKEILGYSLFGVTKPGVILSFSDRFPANKKELADFQVLKKYLAMQEHPNFPFVEYQWSPQDEDSEDTVKKQKPKETITLVYMFNRTLALQAIHQNLDMFEKAYGTDKNPEEFFEAFLADCANDELWNSKDRDDTHLLEQKRLHELALGILLGFGRENAELYWKRIEVNNWDQQLLLPRTSLPGRLLGGFYSLIPGISKDYQTDQPFATVVNEMVEREIAVWGDTPTERLKELQGEARWPYLPQFVKDGRKTENEALMAQYAQERDEILRQCSSFNWVENIMERLLAPYCPEAQPA